MNKNYGYSGEFIRTSGAKKPLPYFKDLSESKEIYFGRTSFTSLLPLKGALNVKSSLDMFVLQQDGCQVRR